MLNSHLTLGVIGDFNKNIFSKEFIEMGAPELEERIRLTFQKRKFKINSLKRFNKNIIKEEEKLKIVDSLNIHPTHYVVEIADKVGLIAALNGDQNENLKTFLERTRKSVIVTSMHIYFPAELETLIDQASEIYLVNNKKSSYSLEVLKKDRTREIVEFNDGIAFGYDFSSFCWSEDFKHQLEIAALKENGRSCPGDTEKKPEKLKNKDLFEKL